MNWGGGGGGEGPVGSGLRAWPHVRRPAGRQMLSEHRVPLRCRPVTCRRHAAGGIGMAAFVMRQGRSACFCLGVIAKVRGDVAAPIVLQWQLCELSHGYGKGRKGRGTREAKKMGERIGSALFVDVDGDRGRARRIGRECNVLGAGREISPPSFPSNG